MAMLDDPSRGEIPGILKRLRALETASPLRNASIGAGGLRVYDGGMITIENGGLRVTGTAEIIGKLIASGIIEFSGEVTISGPLDISGLTQIMGDLILQAGGKFTAGTIELNPDGSAKFGTLTIDPDGTLTSGEATINPDGSAEFGTLTIDADGTLKSGEATIKPDGSAKFGKFDIAKNGDLDSKGTLDIKGKSTLQDDLEVKDGGKITLGSLELEPGNGGQINFRNGGITSDDFGLGIVNTVGIQLIANNVSLPGVTAKAGVEANVHIDSAGRLWRVSK